ncbi:hypothetical protein RND71_021324 [Anisodus tanguticus]|uniref:Uncharacterized protein n=1 Tax=Anisodus tanguticus TaxID=243964 RepID=A0AAE1VG08_9SOLA|nr:hypothetical protein RND71_021324 [Anisodus tanguticus]
MDKIVATLEHQAGESLLQAFNSSEKAKQIDLPQTVGQRMSSDHSPTATSSSHKANVEAIDNETRDVFGKSPTDTLFLDKYGKICLCLDEIVCSGLLENIDKRLVRLKPATDF